MQSGGCLKNVSQERIVFAITLSMFCVFAVCLDGFLATTICFHYYAALQYSAF